MTVNIQQQGRQQKKRKFHNFPTNIDFNIHIYLFFFFYVTWKCVFAANNFINMFIGVFCLLTDCYFPWILINTVEIVWKSTSDPVLYFRRIKKNAFPWKWKISQHCLE